MNKTVNKLTLIGHRQTMDHLLKSFAEQQPNHAYLLIGPEHVGKARLTQILLQHIFCEQGAGCGNCSPCQQVLLGQHPDLWWVERQADKQDITIDQIRELQQFIKLGSLNGDWRVVVINGAHNLNEQSANALLKSLEEPGPRVVFFLISSEPKRMLPTIVSRCFVLQLGLVSYTEIQTQLMSAGASQAQAEEIAHLAQGLPGIAMELQHQPELIANEYEKVELFWNLLTGEGFGNFVKYVESDIKETAEGERAARQAALSLVANWQRAARDVLLAKFELYDQLSFVKYKERSKAASGMSALKLLELNQKVQTASEQLQANAHIKLTLESLAYSLSLLTSKKDIRPLT